MERISELLDAVRLYEKEVQHHPNGTVVSLWMTEATNRIQELEYKLETLKNVVDLRTARNPHRS